MEPKPLRDSTVTSEPKPRGRGNGRSVQPLPIRVAHWLNVPLIVLMAGSGLQILTAYPSLGPKERNIDGTRSKAHHHLPGCESVDG